MNIKNSSWLMAISIQHSAPKAFTAEVAKTAEKSNKFDFVKTSEFEPQRSPPPLQLLYPIPLFPLRSLRSLRLNL
jgi:hypothetical protein